MKFMSSIRALAGLVFCIAASSAWAVDFQDHYEFDGALVAPYTADASGRRDVDLLFRFPGADNGTLIAWRLELLSPRGTVLRSWRDETHLDGGAAKSVVSWYERDPLNGPLPDGLYNLRLSATPLDPTKVGALGMATVDQRVNRMLELAGKELEPQTFPIRIGNPIKPSIVPMARLPIGSNATESVSRASTASSTNAATAQSVPVTGGSGYTVYYGNLHSQTNHSDGGGAVSSCSGAQDPQAGAYGPSDAYPYAMNEGLDFLMTSEHNHLFDGSTGTNTSASPTTAHNLYQSGLSAASSFNSAHPNFLAIYGMEWGVISNGGHLNIFNSNQLLEWEYNSSNQLIGDVYSPKSDYGSLYTQMKSNGWIGQFNHPATSGQFTINGTDLAYAADGDSVMVACEVTNTSAFSNNTTETETSRTSYETACNTLLEAGYHVAFTTDQDNHCANWGASYPNRTGVLIPTGTALSNSSFLAALQARHVFATLDKTAQLTLTASGGHIMGDRFNNSGALTLTVNYAPGTGRSASQVQVYQGVPGSNGTVSVLSTTATTTLTPAAGDHFYYAKVTQDNGTLLWSAPIWVTEGSGTGDTTAPTVSASESGSSGSITLSATASDNVGVTKVEFYVDSTLKATDTATPYSSTLDSTTLSNGSHSLTAKAYDAAGNVGTSSAESFTISNSSSDTTAPTVSASESGSSGTITLSATASDNVGVTKVEFYVDSTLKATDTATPYSSTLDSTTLSNGSHSLTAKAYDAAGNVGTSSAVSFSISNTSGTATEQVTNGGFESGSTGWTATSGVINNDSGEAAHAGSYKAWLDGYGSATTDTVYQAVTIPSAASSATFTFWLHIDTAETSTSKAYDTLTVQVRSSSGSVLATLATYSNLNAASGYAQKSFSLASYKGQTVQIFFSGVEDSQYQTSFVIDDVSVKTQ